MPYFHLSALLQTASLQLLWAAVAVVTFMLVQSKIALKLRNWWQLHSQGPAEVSMRLLNASPDKVVTADTLHWGSITYVGRHDVAAQVFKSSAFLNRLGSSHGLRLLGMYEEGIIWNNDTSETGWQKKRDYFAKGIQALVRTHSTYAKHITLVAFKLTLAEHCHAATASGSTHTSTAAAPTSTHTGSVPPTARLPPVKVMAAMPLLELASTAAGISLDLTDGRDFLRLVTFRVTAALALGLPVDALSMEEALQVVHKVGAFFKAWDYFLLRPGWLCRLLAWTPAHRKHLAAVKDLQAATAQLIKMAVAQHSSPCVGEEHVACSNTSAAMGTSSSSNSLPTSTLQAESPDDSSAFSSTTTSSPQGPQFAECFLGKLRDAEARGQLSPEAVHQLVLEMLLAGTDTSSISMYYLMVQRAEDPHLERELLEEVLAAVGNIWNLSDAHLAEKLPISPGHDPLFPKCQAALSEAMRFKPVGPVSIRQATTPVTLSYRTSTGTEVVKQLQARDTVIVSMATMHRDPAVFVNPELFSPFKNFSASSHQAMVQQAACCPAASLAAPPPAAAESAVTEVGAVACSWSCPKGPEGMSAAVTGNTASDAFRPFGHGRKGCVGKELGWMEMKVMLACWLLTIRFRQQQNHNQAAAAAESSPPRQPLSSSNLPPDTDTDAAAADDGAGLPVAAQNTSDAATHAGSVGLDSSSAHRAPKTALHNMTTRWEVASQPIKPLPLHVRCVHVPGASRWRQPGGLSSIYVVGPHGSGKTTLCEALVGRLKSATAATPASPKWHSSSDLAPCGDAGQAGAIAATTTTPGPGSLDAARLADFVMVTETARKVMAANSISRDDFMLAASGSHSTAKQDAVFLRLQQLIVEALAKQKRERAAPGTTCFIHDRGVLDALAYTADRFGINSTEVWSLLDSPATQELLMACRAPSSLVVLVPPYDSGMSGPVDDGVRMTTPTANLLVVFQLLMQQLQVPYEVLRAVEVDDRVAEMMCLIGRSG